MNSRENIEFLSVALDSNEIKEATSLIKELQEIELSLSIHLLHDHLTSEEQAVLERKEIILTRLKVLDRNDFIARPQYLLHTLVKTIKFNFAKFSEMHPAYLSLDVRSCFYNLDEKIEFLTQVLKQNNPSPDDYRIACYGLYGLIASFKEYDSIKAREEYSYNFNEMIDNLIQLNSYDGSIENGTRGPGLWPRLAENFYHQLVNQSEDVLKPIYNPELLEQDKLALETALVNLDAILNIDSPCDPQLVKHVKKLIAEVKKIETLPYSERTASIHYYVKVIDATTAAINAVYDPRVEATAKLA